MLAWAKISAIKFDDCFVWIVLNSFQSGSVNTRRKAIISRPFDLNLTKTF